MSAEFCIGCGHEIDVLLDFGPQPPSNRFLKTGERETDRHPLALGECKHCGLLQLVDPMPIAMIRSRFSWLGYNEPEAHLDDLLSQLAQIVGLTPDMRILGASFNDRSALQKLKEAGFRHVDELEMAPAAVPAGQFPGMETAQDQIKQERLRAHTRQKGAYDLIICRYLFEHARRPVQFLNALVDALTEDGQLLIEVPDCTKFVEHLDYSFVWEEHTSYFCEASLRRMIEREGLVVSLFIRYEYALEDSLIFVVGRRRARGVSHPGPEGREASPPNAASFAAQFMPLRKRYREAVAERISRGETTAIMGASHLSAKFLNVLGLREGVRFVVDDNPNKQRMLMPGSQLPIVPSQRLKDDRISLCLLALNPASEEKALRAHSDYLREGGRFGSIFRLSRLGGLLDR